MEREIAEMKEEISQAFKHDLRSVNQEEHKFWKDLLHACLEPDLDALGSEEILKGEHFRKKLHTCLELNLGNFGFEEILKG